MYKKKGKREKTIKRKRRKRKKNLKKERIKRERRTKHRRKNSPALEGNPQKKGNCIKIMTKKT